MDDRPIDEVYDTMMDVEQNPMGAWQEIQQLVAEVARLRQALRTMIYEITDLSPLEDDGTYWCKISDEALTSAIASVEHKD